MKIFLNKLSRFYRSAYQLAHFPSLFEIFFTDKKIFTYYGFLGDSNFGDELVFESAKAIFQPNILLPVRKFMPISLKIYCFFFKSRFSGIIVGGGTLIGPFWDQGFFLKFLEYKKPVYVHGTGVHKSIDCIDEWTNVFARNVYGGVRGCISKDNLAPIYPPIKVLGDAAFAFFDKNLWDRERDNKKNILINWGTHFDYEGQNFSRQEFKKFIKHSLENGYKVQFLPFHHNDKQLGVQLKSEFPRIELLAQPDNYLEAVAIFEDCSFAIGERLHFTVMAILTKSPFISLNYGNKHLDLLESIDLSHVGVEPESFSFDFLYNSFNNRSTFNWGTTENIISGFKDLQTKEANAFMEKN